jgi:Tfp pilus assembly protein PilX
MKKALNQSGAIFALSLIVLTTVLVITIVLVSSSFTYKQSSRYSLNDLETVSLAEAGVDKAVAALNQSGGSYNGESETAFGAGSYSVAITNEDASTKKIVATGYIPNKTNPKSQKTIELKVSKGVGIAFNYGVQVGQGGLQMSNSSTVNGSVYSLGNIVMSGSTRITGDAYVAGGVQPTADQESECTDPNCQDYTFGQASPVLDVAQSFQPTTTAVLNKVALKLKKVGSPPNVTVKILRNNGSNPNPSSPLATGTLSASTVTSQYGFAEVAFNPPPTLTANTTYWILIDTSANASNYWRWSSDSLQGYTRGVAKYAANHLNNPVWSNVSPAADLGFKTYMGGVATSISGSNSATVDGNAYANTITDMIIGKDAYYQVQSGITVSGSNCSNNTHCHPGSTDPATITMPISQANIDEWKEEAEDAGALAAVDCNPATVWGPGKYTGSITMSNSCKETIKTPIWVTGNLNMSNNSELKLDPSFGASSGAFIVDNFITLSNASKLVGSGTAGSYLIAVSEFNTKDDPSQRTAITISNNGNQGVVYSNLGAIQVSNSNTMTEITGWKLILSNSVTVNYDQGLSGAFFNSGPSGSYSVIKGSYQVK